MTLAELRDLFRIDTNDTVAPYLWSDAHADEYANEAQIEACRRAHLLRDSTTDAICALAVTAGDPLVTLDPRTLDIRRARLASQTQPLASMTVEDMDAHAPGWEQDHGTPSAIVTDYQSGAVRLWPTPIANDTLKLTASRLPLADLKGDTDKPEIRPEHQRALVQWMLHRAYAREDAETYDPNRSAIALARFEAEFGRRSSARNEHWMRERHGAHADPIA